VNDLENVYVYDIDDLKDVVELNMDQRKQEAIRAERIVEEEVVKFEKWLKTLAVVPTIISLREKADTILRGELKKSRSLLEKLTSDQIAAVETLNRSIAEKLINDPILFLKGKADRPALDMYIDVTRKLFGLDKDTDGRT
jgi:glutamyl-tRNA reductase